MVTICPFNFSTVTSKVPLSDNTIIINNDVLVTFPISVRKCLAKAN